MFTLLFTAFLPKVGVQFDWVTYHWIAGIVLTVSIIFHIIHASFWLDFWSIWPDRDRPARMRGEECARFMGKPAPPPRRFAKYPLENKLYHGVIIVRGSVASSCTGVFMMFRVRTIFLPAQSVSVQRHDVGPDVCAARTGRRRTDRAGHGARLLRGSGRRSCAITKSMIFGWMNRDFYLKQHDPERWMVETASSSTSNRDRRPRPNRCWLRSASRCDAIEECYEFMLAYAAQGLPSDQGSESGGQVREFLHRAVEALDGSAESCAMAVKRGRP